jgi:SAM-dependent methyltransferase
MRFLDIAAGSGALSLPAARLGADVLAIDLSPGMLEYLAARAAEEGLDGIETRVMDGHNLTLPSDTFDIAGSQYGIMLLPDLPRAVSEAVRVTKPGGRVFVTVYGFPHEIEFLGFFMQALKEVNPDFQGMPSDPPPPEFQAADPMVLSERLGAAGLHDVQVETVSEELRFASGQALWDWIINSNPIAGKLTADLDTGELEAVIDSLERQIRERSGSGAHAVLSNPSHIGVGDV